MYNCTLHNWQSLVDPCPLCLNPNWSAGTSSGFLPALPRQSESFNDYVGRILDRPDEKETKETLIKQILIRDKEIKEVKHEILRRDNVIKKLVQIIEQTGLALGKEIESLLTEIKTYYTDENH